MRSPKHRSQKAPETKKYLGTQFYATGITIVIQNQKIVNVNRGLANDEFGGTNATFGPSFF